MRTIKVPRMLLFVFMASRMIIPAILLVALSSLIFITSDKDLDVKMPRITLKDSAIKQKHHKIKEALLFSRIQRYDTSFCILIDYSLHSGLKRAYLANPAKNMILDSFMVSHGCGPHDWGSDQSKEKALFSNAFESHCSSLGKYKMGERAYSSWGINVKYMLYGLDSSNSNAYKRTIVLHGWGDIPEEETYPNGIPEGWGCPAVSNGTMYKLDSMLQARKRPVLMWIYN